MLSCKRRTSISSSQSEEASLYIMREREASRQNPLLNPFFIEAKENCNHEINQLDEIGWEGNAHFSRSLSYHTKVVTL